jgi:transcriptional regulator with XRE-family HTH domain
VRVQLGDVLKKERERRGLTVEETAIRMELSPSEVAAFEAGTPELERWGPALARLAVALRTPTSRLLSASGRTDGLRPGGVAALIRAAREAAGLGPEELADMAGVAREEYAALESGGSPLETLGPLLLRWAELVEVPLFNLFYPCGVPFAELEDYP